MKNLLLVACAGFLSCGDQKQRMPEYSPTIVADTTVQPDPGDSIIAPPKAIQKKYANKRFRNVTVVRTGEGYRIQGQGQIFEASFNWVVEDGHNELQKGYEMTNAGAPEWGNFDFTVNVKKDNPNTVLHLIIFETSAKDGSRQHELAIPLQ